MLLPAFPLAMGGSRAAAHAGRVMLNVRPGDRVQVKREHDEGCALTQIRTPPGTVTAVKGTGMDARIIVKLDGGQVMAYQPGELDRIVLLD